MSRKLSEDHVAPFIIRDKRVVLDLDELGHRQETQRIFFLQQVSRIPHVSAVLTFQLCLIWMMGYQCIAQQKPTCNCDHGGLR